MSDWKQDSARRRDARHGGPVPTTKARPSKDRKRWCRGKVGVEHKPVAKTYDEAKGPKIMPSGRPLVHAGWWLLICTECGKELDFHFPWRGHNAERRPHWVPTQHKSDHTQRQSKGEE